MNILDVIIILLVFTQALFWARKGLALGLFSLLGFWLGLFAGAWLAPYILEVADGDSLVQIVLASGTIIILALMGKNVGRAVGVRLGSITQKLHLEKFDSVLGAAFSAIMTLVIVWLSASIVSGLPVRELNRQIRESVAIQTMNDVLPPAPDVISKLASLINADGFPQVFTGLEPRPIEPVSPPTSGEVAEALANAGKSTVRIESEGCGGISVGSGFVAAPDLVVTNAHVIAGVDQPVVQDVNGVHAATPVLFDPDLDIAILRTNGLAGKPLPLAPSIVPRGTTATVLGYPGGGPLEPDAAGVLRQLDARGRNIYNDKVVERSIYELQTNIEQGNSGGPVVLPDGTVIGVIFAKSVSFNSTGYAITSTEVIPLRRRAQASNQVVSAGTCTAVLTVKDLG